VIAAEHPEVAFRLGELAFLNVFYPRAVDPDRDIVLLLARHRAGVTPDAPVAKLKHEKTTALQPRGKRLAARSLGP
jgi:hypothetical protein